MSFTQLAAALQGKGWRLAVAESCTGGLLAASCTSLAGSSAWFYGGLVSYDNRAKMQWLGVSEEQLAEHGAVSLEVAQAMAQGLVSRSGVELALSITGIAGPGGGSDTKPVGTVCFALQSPKACRVEQQQFEGDRAQVRAQAVTHALQMLLHELQ